MMESENKCQCNFCKQSRKFMSIVEKLPDEDKQWMEDFYDHYISISESENYNSVSLKNIRKTFGVVGGLSLEEKEQPMVEKLLNYWDALKMFPKWESNEGAKEFMDELVEEYELERYRGVNEFLEKIKD